MGYALEVALTLLEQFIFVDYIDTRFERVYDKKYIYGLYVILLTTIVSLCNLNKIISNFTIIIIIIASILLMKRTYQIDLKTGLIATFIFYALSLSIDVIVLGIGTSFTSEQASRYLTIGDSHRIILGLFSKSLLFIVSKILGDKKIKYKELPKKYWYFIVTSYAISILIMFLITDLMFVIDVPIDALVPVIGACIGILFFNFINVYVYLAMAEQYQKEADYAVIESSNDIQYKYILQNEDTFKEIRKVKHDLNNKLIGLLYLIEENKVEDAASYIKEINQDLQNASIYYMTGNSVIDAIINQKYCICKEHKIELNLERIEIKPINIRAQDLCNILGNVLDNAIEGCMKSGYLQSHIWIDIYTKKEYFVINIKNTCRSDSISDNLETSKNEKWHGIGIKSIKETANRYEGNVVLQHKDDIFTTKVILKNKN